MIRCAMLAVLLVAFCAEVGTAAEYFVSPSGNNGAAGTAAAPWQTLQFAAGVVGPGDRVVVRAGEYAGFHLETSGTAVAPIEFVAEPGVLVNASNPIRPQHGINLENASHVIVDGFAVTGMERAGVRSVGVDGDTFASHVTIRNVHSYDNGYWGILTGFVEDLLIENNETSGSAVEHGIYVSNSADRPTIRDNKVWGNRGNGIHMNGDASLGGDGVISGALVSGNVIYDNGLGGGSGINMDGVQDSRIENNLLYDNHASGISLYRIDGGGGSTGNVVVNNTVHQASNGRWALNIQGGSTGNTALNNILISEHSFRGAIDISDNSLPGFTSDHNAVISRFTTDGGNDVLSLAEWQAATGNDQNSVVANAAALFVDWNDGDYLLKDMSPAINLGTNELAPAVDLAGNPRPLDGEFDAGAYEWTAAILMGDYNGDGTVDAADFVRWRDTLGAEVPEFSGADGDGSGVIGVEDFGVWRDGFGVGEGEQSGGVVAEPALPPIMMLLTLIVSGVVVLSHRQPSVRIEKDTTCH